MKTNIIYLYFLFSGLLSCSKTDFLNEKSDASLTIPSTLGHLQALLDNDAAMNGANGFSLWYPGLLETGADDIYYLEQDYNTTMPEYLKKIYSWQPDPYPGMDLDAWFLPYSVIFRCNFILEKLEDIGFDDASRQEYDHIYASALFYRTFAYYALVSLFSPIYDPSTDNSGSSIPIRHSADINETLRRGTVEQVYGLMTDDLKKAIPLLPSEPLYKTRPSKRSCMAMLSRIYLARSDFERAYLYADSALMINDDLLDYNDYSTTVNYPFARFNNEVIFNCSMLTPRGANTYVDQSLIDQYDPDDLRLSLYFKKVASRDAYMFYGNYDGTIYHFVGLANDEVLLNRAESAVRVGRAGQGLADLNRLMKSRWKSTDGVSLYTPYPDMPESDLIRVILHERRKELVWRGIRWQDLKRLNLETPYQKTLVRNINGQTFELPPNSPRYVYPIPSVVTDFNKNL